jgi:hypothetical protein
MNEYIASGIVLLVVALFWVCTRIARVSSLFVVFSVLGFLASVVFLFVGANTVAVGFMVVAVLLIAVHYLSKIARLIENHHSPKQPNP